MAVPDSLSYTPRSGQQQSDDGAFPSDGTKSKSNRMLVIDKRILIADAGLVRDRCASASRGNVVFRIIGALRQSQAVST